MAADPLLTVTAAATYLGVSRPTVYLMMRAGQIPWVTLNTGAPGRRGRRIRASDLEAFICRNTVGGWAVR